MSAPNQHNQSGEKMPNEFPGNFPPGNGYYPNYPVQQVMPFQQGYGYPSNYPGQQMMPFQQVYSPSQFHPNQSMMQIPGQLDPYKANFAIKNDVHDNVDFKNRTMDFQSQRGAIMTNVSDGDKFHDDFQGALQVVFSKDTSKTYTMKSNK